MKIARRLLFFFLLCLSFAACSLLPNELKQAESLIETAPDSALHILQHLSPDKYKSDESRALYGLLMIEALNRKKLPLQPDSLLDFSIAYYQEHPDKDRLANAYFYKGRMCKYNAQYEKATNFYLKSLDEIDANGSADNSLLGRINFDLGDINIVQEDYSLARKKYTISYGYFRKAKMQSQAFFSLLNIGRTYYLSAAYTKAQCWYQRILPQANDSILLGSLYQEMGMNFYKLQRNDSALLYYRRVINYPFIGNNRAIRYHLLADLYFTLKNTDSAYFYALHAFKYNPPVRTQRECYRILTNAEFLRGNMKEMSLYMNKYVQLGDSIRRIDAQAKGSFIENLHETRKEMSQSRFQVWLLRAGILLVIICFCVFIVSMVRRTKKEKHQIQETHSEEKAGIRKQVIGGKSTLLQQKIREIKDAHSTEHKAVSPQEKEAQIRKIYNDLLHINDQRFFFEEMDIVLNGLVTKLRNRYSDINPKELTRCCLHLLNIPGYDMLILLDYKTHNSLKSLKGRLSDKFELENATFLGAFLMDILSED